MSSGIAHVEVGDPLYASDTNQVLFVSGTGDMAARALRKPLARPPGSHYEYSSLTSLLLSELITRQLTDSRDPAVRATAYRRFAEERLFRPAGISGAVFDFDGSGTQVGGSIIYMPLKDWGRFGQLLLTGKGVDGSTVIALDWLAFLRTPSETDPGYGGHVWLNRPRSAENARYPALFPGKGSASAFAAVGHLGQYVIVSPENGLVLVRLGKTQDEALQPVRDALGEAMGVLGRSSEVDPPLTG
jgi:CubicO group peptidase (beta-lactamase class C family)